MPSTLYRTGSGTFRALDSYTPDIYVDIERVPENNAVSRKPCEVCHKPLSSATPRGDTVCRSCTRKLNDESMKKTGKLWKEYKYTR